MIKKAIVSATMLGVVFFALASSGGGKKKTSTTPALIPISAKGNFTLNVKPSYSGSQLMSRYNSQSTGLYRSVASYQKGNTVYLIPSSFKLVNRTPKVSMKPNGLSLRSNLNVVDLKIRLCK